MVSKFTNRQKNTLTRYPAVCRPNCGAENARC